MYIINDIILISFNLKKYLNIAKYESIKISKKNKKK